MQEGLAGRIEICSRLVIHAPNQQLLCDPMPAVDRNWRRIQVASVLILLGLGIFLRLPHGIFTPPTSPLHFLESLHPRPKMEGLGVDEGLYRGYVTDLSRVGLFSYPKIVDHYIELQERLSGSILPPVRFLYIFAAYVWHLAFGTEALGALHGVSSLFSILVLILSGVFAWRLKGPAAGLGVTTLMCCAPTQLHMSQHALVDGFFTFWALLCLWLLWESLRKPGRAPWLVAYTLSLSLLVLTKENAFFVFVAVVALILLNRWFHFGTVDRNLIVCTVVGPLLGVVVLVLLAGGLDVLLTTYRLSVTKNYNVTYAILTGDGPWYRYLVDLLLVSPLVLLLALGTVFRLDRTKKPEIYLTVFIAASYLIMCNIKYGMNLRYANMWDMPLRLLAFTQIVALTQITRYRIWLGALGVAAIAVLELRQYYILFVHYPLYELPTYLLMRALHILKFPGDL
jgi:Dolichyl-phosphate-mannose-protein mannosyltransferase